MTEGATTPSTTTNPAPQTNGAAPSGAKISPDDITEDGLPFVTDEQLDTAIEELADKGDSDDSPEASDEDSGEGENSLQQQESDSAAHDDSEESEEGSEVPKKRSVEDLEAELEKKDRQNREQQNFIQRQNQRYGDLKKQVLAEIAGIEEAMEEMSSAEQVKAGLKLDKLEGKKQQIEAEEARFNSRVESYELVSKVIPQKDFNIDAMADVLAEDKECDPEYIARFKKDPFGEAKGHELVMLHKAAKYKYGMRVLATALKRAEAENNQLKGNPKKILSKIENVSKNSSGVTGKNAGGRTTSQPLDYSESEIATMSDEDLANLERSLMSRS